MADSNFLWLYYRTETHLAGSLIYCKSTFIVPLEKGQIKYKALY